MTESFFPLVQLVGTAATMNAKVKGEQDGIERCIAGGKGGGCRIWTRGIKTRIQRASSRLVNSLPLYFISLWVAIRCSSIPLACVLSTLKPFYNTAIFRRGQAG